MLDFLAISLGAVTGANARYWLSRYAARFLGPVFPYGTLIINVLGSLIVGFFLIWTSERVLVDPRWRFGPGESGLDQSLRSSSGDRPAPPRITQALTRFGSNR